jgi:histidinol-phosphatase
VSEIRDPRFELACAAVKRASEIISPLYQSDLKIMEKDNGSEVTKADRDSEILIREMISKDFPEDNVVGEEFENIENGDAKFTWSIDPIDGTRAFSKGVPFFGTMIGLKDESGPLFGMINLPALGESIWGYRGKGAFWKNQRGEVSKCCISKVDSVEASVLSTSGAEYFKDKNLDDRFYDLVRKTKFHRTWGDCYGYSLLATGRIDVMIDGSLEFWDILPLIPIIRESGGTITDLKGEDPLSGYGAIACHPDLHQKILNHFI